MPVPLLRIEGSGAIPDPGAAKEVLAKYAGNFSVLEAGGLLLLTPDMGSGAGPRDDEIVATTTTVDLARGAGERPPVTESDSFVPRGLNRPVSFVALG